MSFNLRVKPMDSVQMNLIEAMNDTIFLLSCYNMFVFTDFVHDVDTRYSYSKFVFNTLIYTLGLQMALVILEIALIGLRKIRLYRARTKYRLQLKERQKQLKRELANQEIERLRIDNENAGAARDMIEIEELAYKMKEW